MKFKKVAVNTTYLEMLKRPVQTEELNNISIERETELSSSKYLEIYKAIGAPWGWASRLTLERSELEKIIHNSDIHIYIMKVDSRLAGFCELDARKKPDIEIVYLGLLPTMIGQNLGHKLINFACHRAFDLGDRIWLHTCEYDHPKAIEFYQKMGFKIFDQRVDEEIYSLDFLNKASVIT